MEVLSNFVAARQLINVRVRRWHLGSLLLLASVALSGQAFAQQARIVYWGPTYTGGIKGAATIQQSIQSVLDYDGAIWGATCTVTSLTDWDPTQEPYRGAVKLWEGHCDRNGQVISNLSYTVNATQYFDDPGANLGDSCGCHGGTGSGSGGKGGVTMVGDPVNPATGNKYEEADDFESPSGLVFRRFYNSDPSVVQSNMGAQWRHFYDRRLVLSGPSDSEPTNVVVYRPDGLIEGFILLSGSWTTYRNIKDRLSSVRDGQGNLIGFKLFIAGLRVTENYDRTGQLQSITDANRQTTSLSYSTADTPTSVAPKAGLLLSVADPTGRTLSFSYDSDEQLTTATLPDGSSLTYVYQNHKLTSVLYPGGTSTQYLYNEPSLGDAANPYLAPKLTGVIDENGTRLETTTYDAKGRVVAAVQGGNLSGVSLTYNTNGSTSITHPLGASTTLSFRGSDSSALLAGNQTGSCGNTCQQDWSVRQYDINGYPSMSTDNRGLTTQTSYDANGLLQSKIEAKGTSDQRTTATAWDSTLRVPLLTTVANSSNVVKKKTQWTYNAYGQVTATCVIDPVVAPSYVCSPAGATPVGVQRTVNTYCADINATTCPLQGLLLSTDGPRSDVSDTVAYAYYKTTDVSGCSTAGGACHHVGDLMSTTDGAGLVTINVSYDNAGRVTRVKDPSGVLTDFTYTPRGWLASKIIRANASGAASASDSTTITAYNPDGTVHQVTDPDGVTTTYTYDAAHRLTDVADANGSRIHYVLDGVGNRTTEQVLTSTGTIVRSLARTFNTLGQLTTLTDGLGHTVLAADYSDSYDGNGNLVHSRDGLGIEQTQTYDGLNRRVSSLEDYQGTDAATANSKTATAFDSLDHISGFVDPDGLATTTDIDALGNSVGLHSPDTGTTANTFDAAGNLLNSSDAVGSTRAATYDAKNRILTATFADASLNVQYKYDEADSITGCTGNLGKGRLTRIIEGNGGLVYCYDRRGNVLKKLQTVGTVTRTTTYTWTLANRLKSVTTPNGTVVAYTRNALGQIASIKATPAGGVATVVASAISYKPFGPVASYKLGDGQTVTLSYDAAGSLTDVVSTAFSLHVKRDAMGNITAIGNAAGVPAPTEAYTYDALYRLTGIKAADGSNIEAYTYNKTGDRLTKTAPGLLTGSYNYAVGTHQLVGVGTTTRQVDARGNTTSDVLASGTYGYGYNARNRLTIVQNSGVTVGSYVLNALGQRVQKAAGDLATRFDYLEDGRLLSEATGPSGRDYIWLDGIPVGVLDVVSGTPSFAFVHADALGAPRAVTTAAGAVLWQWPYASNPFGEKVPTSSTGYTLNLRLPGQYFDAESGLNYNVNRDYEPATGRYIQSDPLGLDGGTSTYLYAAGLPLTSSDPSGLVTWHGKAFNTNASVGVGAGVLLYDLTSDCVGGKKGRALVRVVGPAVGLNIKGTLPVGVTSSDVSFNDRLSYVDPGVLAGWFSTWSIGGALGRGFSCSMTQLGGNGRILAHPEDAGAWSEPSCSPERGLELGAGGMAGSATLVQSSIISCGCDDE